MTIWMTEKRSEADPQWFPLGMPSYSRRDGLKKLKRERDKMRRWKVEVEVRLAAYAFAGAETEA